MNLFNIVEEIEKVDPEFNERVSPRRDAIKNITSFGSKVAVAALPFALGGLFKKAYAATPAAASVTDVLNYALTLEYLESYFYNQGTAAAGLIPASDKAYIADITDDENAHVKFLQDVIKQLGGTPVDSPKFDLTAGNGSGNGPFKDVLTNYQTFLAVSETFEDTGVRAYKGAAPSLLGNQVVLTAALSIHAVEARHASAIRYLRTIRGYEEIAVWINSTAGLGNDTGIALVNGNYKGEDNVMQGGLDVSKLMDSNGKPIGQIDASAAFDEPLSMQDVLDLLVGSFIVH
ncbi:ferritin-like domain-containing protein [Mucilaginibacter sp.]|uniref:ferritin-like domain-containing protein n=1 Tax=Mucilaginibacter sp. TaxID=1882438 RepID=UPI002B86F5DF|nr:ferritin-like domain-containing protein [Mucilaginibacter sp.]HTI57442.1 ferritin-like domain-containing protein [Mucilaginibacter sp.]